RRVVRLSSTVVAARVINWACARHCNSRRRLRLLRGPRVALLEHAVARDRACGKPGRPLPMGASGAPRAALAAWLAARRHVLCLTRTALRLRAGAVDDALARRRDLLGGEPVSPAGRVRAPDPAARRRGR